MIQFCYFRPHFGIETVSCSLLQQIARMVGHGLKLEKKGRKLFQVLMLSLPKSQKILRLVFPDETCSSL